MRGERTGCFVAGNGNITLYSTARRNISSRCVTVAHCCCFVRLLCAELFLVQGS